MSGRGLAGLALLVAALLAAGCSGFPGRSASADDIEEALAESDFHAVGAECEQGTRGWDYVCRFADVYGMRWKVGVLVDGRRVTRSSAPVAENAILEAPRQAGDERYEDWIAAINHVCRAANAELRALPMPQSRADFEAYVGSLRELGVRMRARLNALPAAPNAADRKTFDAILALLDEDVEQAAVLQDAIRRGDNPAIQRVFGKFAERTAEENALLNRLGGDCSEAA